MSSSLGVLKTEILEPYLLIDSGNTRTKAAICLNGKVLELLIFENTELEEAKKSLLKQHFSQVLMASSGNQSEEIQSWFLHTPFRLLSHSNNLGIEWAYTEPERLGIDRMAGMLGAHHLFPGQNVCVVDAGTCMTIDFLRADKKHLGGLIAPGLEMRLQAMNYYTSKLPYVSKFQSDIYPGTDTNSCISGGAVWGILAEIEGHLERISPRFSGPIQLILCGGDADFLAQRIKADNFVVPDLVIQGLNAVISNSG